MTTIVTSNSIAVPVSTSPGATVTFNRSTSSANITIGQAGPQGPVAPKTLTILEPFAGDSYTLLYNIAQKTLANVSVGLLGSGSPSVTFEIKQAVDRTTAGTAVVASTTASTVGTVTTPTISDAILDPLSFVWINITGISGQVDEFHITLNFSS